MRKLNFAGEHDLFIAPDGDDTHCGGSDAPLSTLSGALSRLRQLRQQGKLAVPTTVWVRGGTYSLPRTVVFTPDDSAPVTFRACPGEQPVFDGGRRVTGWTAVQLNGHTVWRAPLPPEITWTVDQLFVNGQRKTRAAFPKKTFLRIAGDNLEHPRLTNCADHFAVRPGDFNPNWSAPQDIEACVIHKWIEERMPFRSFDADSQLFHSTHTSRFELDPADTEYRWENVREALTEPGEYYCDGRERVLYYRPEKQEKIHQLDAVIPAVGCFLRFDGDPEANRRVEWLTFDGLTFRHGGAFRPVIEANFDFHDPIAPAYRNYPLKTVWFDELKQMHRLSAGAPQGAAHQPGSIFLYGAAHCTIANCTVEDGGWYGIAVDAGCSDIHLIRNEFRHLGAGGIRVGGADPETAAHHPALLTERLTATDNHIHHVGELQFSACGIILFHAAANRIEHNHIHDLYYTGISCGWTWGYGPAVTRENRIGWNRIHDLGKKLLSDMGGIYLLGIQPGTRVYNNHISNIASRYYGGWGIYTDEGSSHIVIEENICHDCSCEGFHQHYGRENIVRFNVFALCGDNGIAVSAGAGRTNGYECPGDNYTTNVSLIGNLVITSGKPFFRNGYMISAFDTRELYSDNNCFFDLADKPSTVFAHGPDHWKATLKGWRKMGHDLNSFIADPACFDLAGRDFRLRPESPLLSWGFRNLDLAAAGVREP